MMLMCDSVSELRFDVTGSAVSQHILGHCHLWRVPAGVEEDLHFADHHASHVCLCCGGTHGIFW